MRMFRNWEDNVAAAALAVVFLAVSWGVLARYVAPRPAVWSGEVASLGFAWIVFVGAAAGARQHLHIGVDYARGQRYDFCAMGLGRFFQRHAAAELVHARLGRTVAGL
jgi:TRAP-type mannitol/chloroaromatic compound transport system permease small subunit